ncbi:laminin subunit alpha-5 isoform X3 [Esox lucius]|uniref:laminin subunit alpha-5 isoform X3 n=1 Tax=Esox lucius TaxID=8010 RepID=UPI0014770A2F|nr:laminin subunit alpha-5 isoform X3 [Esox lucius]
MARGPVLGTRSPAAGGPTRFVFLLSCLVICGLSAQGQELPSNGVNGYSLHPPYFNLAEGTKITATATCGEGDNGRSIHDLYCKLVGGPVSGDPSQTIQGQYCDTCAMGDRGRAHPITNAIDGTERWWQSPPLSRSTEFNEVNVTLDLGQLFHVAYVLIKFANSPRPDLWVLERSTNFGESYQPWQFFASSKRDCIERFGRQTIERITHDNDVICTTEYSRIVPLENGEVVVSLVNGRPGAMNFSYSPVLRDFTKATNIRLRFLRTNTLLGHLMGKALRDPTVTRRYYYSIKDISIGGRCVCNGHAEVCDPRDPNDPYRLHCDCQHNTCGTSCEKCCPGFNQLPWKPATTYNANVCEPCNCNRHSYECYYDPEVDQRGASVDMEGHSRGGGVCMECQHHTTGVNCERCVPTYYRSPDHTLDSPLACSPCVCPSDFRDGTCEDLTGRCYCKPSYTGENCDSCAEGYTNFPDCYPIPTHSNSNGEAKNAEEIINCECNAAGTEGNSCRRDPQTRSCVCKPGFTGEHCDSCATGYYGLNCQACRCSGPGCQEGRCDSLTGQCQCRPGFQGYSCDQCITGYFNYPVCQLCGCSRVGSLPEVCDASGRCLCRPEFLEPRCEQCRSGFHSFPNCQGCTCDPRTSLDSSCSASGHCHCRPSYSGTSCNRCAPGFYGFPSCTPCQCSSEGSRFSSCDQVTGQCSCRPNVVGQRCDTCSSGSVTFPLCQAGTCDPAGSVQSEVLPTIGSCVCRPYVEGVACDRCKPLFWNLSPDTIYGCSNCECNVEGTVGGVAECAQSNGQCHCKPNVCSGVCSVCKDGYYNMQGDSLFGCQGCQCDIGGSAGQSCGERNGRCRCRPNVGGTKCDVPRPDHYFPDLHHLKFEIEEGTMLDGRPVRFGYNPLEFEGFSWRGYAQMSPVQSKVVVQVSVSSPDLFQIVLRYVNRGGLDMRGRVFVLEDSKNFLCGNCSEQSKQIVFSPSSEPAFVTVPQNNFVVPFVLNPGTWSVVIEAEGILLDYLVLLPSAYYEAPILQIKVTEPCTYSPAPDAGKNCLLYRYLSLDQFPSVSGNDASCRFDNHLPRPCQQERITQRHPDMAICSGTDLNVQIRGRVSHPGEYVLVVEYANEDDAPQTVSVAVNAPGGRTHQHYITILPCKYSFLCRVVTIDEMNRVAVFTLSTDAEVQLIADRASFFLHQVYLIPREEFTMEYLVPKVHCITTHGHFSPDSSSCIPSRFQTPSDSLVLKEGQWSSVLQADLPSPADLPLGPADAPNWANEGRPPTAADNVDHVRLDTTQNAAVYSARVHTPGRYVFILHYHQPLHPTYPIQVFINGGRVWQGHANASFCPHGYGCRSVLISENQVILDITDNELFLTVQVPDGKTLWLDYVLVVPESSYSSSYLSEEPLDKSYEFISNCGLNSFYINPSTASPFCRSSAVSLSAFFNNGALPCGCHEVGADSDTCEAFGGQCQCRPNVIGRDCSQCATGYWGFPNCRPCACGVRLCEPVTGHCICPPRTLLPECTQCEPQTFGCHPLVGCEVCNCSRPGVATLDVGCDTDSGQCRCKSNIIGRQCDRCAPGFYGYPNCRPCDCNEAGTAEDVCDPYTGHCLCKENVQGGRCDQCRVGTFHLDPTNPKGCTSCFCFGATDRCRSSEKRRTEMMEMVGWVLLSADGQEVNVSVYPDQDLVEADLSDIPDVYQDLHWHAPGTYLGDKVSSYGGYLHYRLDTQTMRGDVLSLPAEASRPDVILMGNEMTLVFMEREYSSPDAPHLGMVHMVEGSFRHAQTGNVVSREELMMVLVRLESLQIRALHSQSAHGVLLREAVLEGAQTQSTGLQANNVEICLCPANYLGDSCQQCAPGYYRDTKGLFLGKCAPCTCNGHSDQCLDGSGICLSCQHNRAGDHCEKCQGGFHGNNSLDGHALSCDSCPCPLQVASNNFAVGCLEKPNRMQCLCMPGYSGPKCERCSPGFYGNPMVIGSTCQPCNCHDNTDPNMLFSDCDGLTGECHSCMHNTAGTHCEICAPGFYGDAITAKNCTRCSCSPCGTASCDPHTGQCHCKPDVTGPRCDQCIDGAFGFETCSGCRRCDCDAAAALVRTCNPRNGACSCQPGVNGPSCRQCAPGYWDYRPEGCKKCDCKHGRCDPRTGECHCAEGLTGRQCDTCSHRYSVPVQHGHDIRCEPCDSCVIVLLDDLDRMNEDFSSAAQVLRNLNASSIVWVQLQNLNRSIHNVSNALWNYNSSLEESMNGADMLEGEIMTINSDINDLEEKMVATANKTDTLEKSIDNTHERALDLLSQIQNIMRDVEDLVQQVNRTGNNKTEVDQVFEPLSEKIRQVEAMLREMRFRSCVGQKKIADRELSEAEKLLAKVNNLLVSRVMDNKALVKDIRARLGKTHDELMDLRDALNQAVNNTARASETNVINEKLLEETQRKLDELNGNKVEVEDLLQMAEESVAMVNDMLSMLHDSKEEYERLAAQLDGARMPLAEKVQKFGLSATKIPLVEAAEKHAQMLNELAMNLSSIISNSNENGFIQRALNASQAYNNIIDGIREAEIAAKKAKKAANDALEVVKGQDMGQRAKGLRNHSVELVAEAVKLQEEHSNEVKPKLQDAKTHLDEAKAKQKTLLKDLKMVQRNLTFTGDDTAVDIQKAKAAAEQANRTAALVEDALAPIREKLDQWQQQYGDVNTTNEDINNALLEANKSVGMLGEAIPMLMKKLDSLQNHSAQMPNISENILRIRQLIAEARKAASKVSVPVKFNGSSGVQVRTPSNLADLAGYTSLKFYISLSKASRARRQDQTDKQFVFYLGNKNSSKEFLGMILQGQRLHWLFNVGGETAEVEMPEDVRTDGEFNSVVLERILQYGQMAISSETSERRVTKAEVEAKGDSGLLNLQTEETVFYVGGYPDSFTPPPPLLLPNFKGCIELETLNEEVLSLYNFEAVFQLNTTEEMPCGRAKPVLTQPWVNDAAYFDGTGYAEVTFKEDSEKRMYRFEQEVKLKSHNGILLMLQSQEKFLCLVVQNGRLQVFYDIAGTLEELKPKDPESSYLKLSDAEPKSLEIIIIYDSTTRVVVRNNRQNLFNFIFTTPVPRFDGSYYLAGVPEEKMPETLKAMFPHQGSLKGCFRNVKAMTSHIDLKRMTSSGISYGCANDLLVAREAHFSGQSYLDLATDNIPNLENNFYAGFGFRTDQRNGIMFYHQAQDGVCQVFLDKGHVVVKAGRNEMKTQKTYSDDKDHYVAFYSNANGVRLYMDDVLEKIGDTGRVGAGSPTALPAKTMYLGGTPYQSRNNHTGCLSNLFIKRDTSSQVVVDLMKANENINVPLECPAAKKPQQILATPPRQKSPKGRSRKPAGDSGSAGRSRSSRESCQGDLASQEVGALHFSGSSHSYQRFDVLPAAFSRTPHISMGLRLNSSDGLVFFLSGSGDGSVSGMSLSVSDGHLLLLIHGGRRKTSVRSRRKYNDGQWHTMFVKREGEKVSLIMDGINAQSKRVSGGEKKPLSPPLYIGGVPSAITSSLLTPDRGGFTGCVRDLNLNGESLASPSSSLGVVPCFQNPLQPGAYFSPQGGHMTIEDSLGLGRDLEILLEVRPVSDSGLLLYAGAESESGEQLSLHLNQGEVTVTLNSGTGEFSTSFTPEESLCDGRWHTITIVKKSNVLQLHVDAASEHSVGPRQGRSPAGKVTVHLGGAPDGDRVPGLPAGLASFHGCVGRAVINQRPAMLSKPLSVHGAVGTQGCPAM